MDEIEGPKIGRSLKNFLSFFVSLIGYISALAFISAIFFIQKNFKNKLIINDFVNIESFNFAINNKIFYSLKEENVSYENKKFSLKIHKPKRNSYLSYSFSDDIYDEILGRKIIATRYNFTEREVFSAISKNNFNENIVYVFDYGLNDIENTVLVTNDKKENYLDNQVNQKNEYLKNKKTIAYNNYKKNIQDKPSKGTQNNKNKLIKYIDFKINTYSNYNFNSQKNNVEYLYSSYLEKKIKNFDNNTLKVNQGNQVNQNYDIENYKTENSILDEPPVIKKVENNNNLLNIYSFNNTLSNLSYLKKEEKSEKTTPNITIVNQNKEVNNSETSRKSNQDIQVQEYNNSLIDNQSVDNQQKDEYSDKTCNGITFSVYEAFTRLNKKINGAIVKEIGTGYQFFEYQDGRYCVDTHNLKGLIPVIIQKDGYLSLRKDIFIGTKKEINIELISQTSYKAANFTVGAETKENTSMLYVQINSQNGVGLKFELYPIYKSIDENKSKLLTENYAIYLDENGFPNLQIRSTTKYRQAFFSNILEGNYNLIIRNLNQEIIFSKIISFIKNEGKILEIDLSQKQILKGKIKKNVLAKLKKYGVFSDEINIELLGYNKFTKVNNDGEFYFNEIYLDCNDIHYIQIDGRKFYRTRLAFLCGELIEVKNLAYEENIDLISTQAQVPLFADRGVILGKINNKNRKIQIYQDSELIITENQNYIDVYFNNDGSVSRTLNSTNKNGKFSLLNVEPGIYYIMSIDKNNKSEMIWKTFVSESSVNFL
jgi:hypothetical protein